MIVLETKVMRGPNYWSSDQHFLIVLKLEVENDKSELASDEIENAAQMFPGLFREPLSNIHVADFVGRVAIQLQLEAGMNTLYSSYRTAPAPNAFFAIFSYENEKSGLHAGKAAVAFANSVIQKDPYDILKDIEELRRIRSTSKLGATTAYILDEVKRRKIPFRRFDNSSLLTLGYGSRQKKIRTAVADTTSALGIELAGDKEETKALLALAHIPVPKGILIYSEYELRKRIDEVKFPLVVKPLGGNHGRGVTTDIHDMDRLMFGFKIATEISQAVIVEEYIPGSDYRFLVINYQLVAVAKRIPAHVVGDGRSTIKQLIDELNKDPNRGHGEKHVLSPVVIDAVTNKLLSEHALTPDSVLEEGRTLVLKDTANISAGGTAEDVTEFVHPETRFMAERIARIFRLDICGVDIITTAIEAPLTRETGAVIEVNAGPGIRMHSNPQAGQSRNVAAPLVDMLFPSGFHPRIPIVSVTGTNGKTTVTRLIAHLTQEAGYTTGYTTTDGIYINKHRIVKGDCAGFQSATDVLFDPLVDVAVLETARGGIIRSGLAFDECDIGIVTNVTGDHLGLKDIHTVEDMAMVKGVVPRSVKKEGHAILNADDDLVYKMREGLHCNIALFSMDSQNPRILQHLAAGGMVSVIENDEVVIKKGKQRITFGNIKDIPLTVGGRAGAMIKNLMPAVLAAEALGFQPETIVEGLKTFLPSPGQTPGRMNIFDFGSFKVMLDYAHNIDGYMELKKFMEKTEAQPKIGVIGVAGDRLDEDIRQVGSIAAEIFDEIIIRHDKDLRGRDTNELTNLLKEGIERVDPEMPVTVISDEMDAILHVTTHAPANSFTVVTTELVDASIELLTKQLAARQKTPHAENTTLQL